MVSAHRTVGLALATLILGCGAVPQAGHSAVESAPVAPVAAPAAASVTPAAMAQPPVEEAAPAAAGLDADSLAKARILFNDWSCSACHLLKDGSGSGHIGPSFDGNASLTRDFVLGRITNGQGAMPGFGGQLTEDEIALLTDYILQVKL